MIKFACPSCNKSIRVDDQHMGTQGKCPKCGHAVKVPDRSTLIEFMCKSCGHWIKVTEQYAGKQGKCPKCKKLVVVPRQEPAPKPDAVAEDPESSDPDETPYEESTTAQTSSASGRRLVTILIGAVTVLIVVIIGLLAVYRPWVSRPQSQSISAPVPPETAETDLPPKTVLQAEIEAHPGTPAEAAPPEKPVVTAAPSQDNRLQFSPSPGDKRRMRVTMTTQYSMSAAGGGPEQDVIGIQSVTVALEAGQSQANGTCPVHVSLAQIGVKEVVQGVTLGEYDSAQASAQDNPMQEIYAPFVGKRFTIRVSGQGEIIDPGLDGLFLAAA